MPLGHDCVSDHDLFVCVTHVYHQSVVTQKLVHIPHLLPKWPSVHRTHTKLIPTLPLPVPPPQSSQSNFRASKFSIVAGESASVDSWLREIVSWNTLAEIVGLVDYALKGSLQSCEIGIQGFEAMASFAAGMVMPVVSGPMVRMQGGKRSTTAKPKKEEGTNFFKQLGEWTQKSSLNETDPLLKKIAEEKKAPATATAPPPEKKGFFGF